jgi:hypothetical protein
MTDLGTGSVIDLGTQRYVCMLKKWSGNSTRAPYVHDASGRATFQ